MLGYNTLIKPLFWTNIMPLSLEEVRRIAMLARLEVSEQEAAAIRDQLNDIFGLIEQLQAVDTERKRRVVKRGEQA